MFLTDITSFVGSFVSMMIGGVTNAITIWDSITFYGFSLLDFCLSIIILPAILSIILSASKSYSLMSRREKRREKE